MRLVCDVWVPGIPVTKGSVNVNRGGTGVRQAAQGYAAWSDAVRRAVLADMNGRLGACWMAVQRTEGAMVRCRYWVPVPVADAEVYGGLWAPGARDGDKLDRAVWDACSKAGVWEDDAQVIEWAGSRRWAGDMSYRQPGVHIGIWAVTLPEVVADRAPQQASEMAYRRAMFGADA
jgi:hypothetical protein